jgi:hypothetical protein
MVYAHNGKAIFGTLVVSALSPDAAVNTLKRSIRFRVVLVIDDFPLSRIKPTK